MVRGNYLGNSIFKIKGLFIILGEINTSRDISIFIKLGFLFLKLMIFSIFNLDMSLLTFKKIVYIENQWFLEIMLRDTYLGNSIFKKKGLFIILGKINTFRDISILVKLGFFIFKIDHF